MAVPTQRATPRGASEAGASAGSEGVAQSSVTAAPMGRAMRSATAAGAATAITAVSARSSGSAVPAGGASEAGGAARSAGITQQASAAATRPSIADRAISVQSGGAGSRRTSSAACESSPLRSMKSGHSPDTTSRSRARVMPT